MRRKFKPSLLAAGFVLSLVFSLAAFADTFIISDTEGSMTPIEDLVKQGKLKWRQNGATRELVLVNPNDKVIFLGDLSGPNWSDQAHPHNMEIRDTFLSFQKRYPTQFQYILGNHEYNRLGYVRDNMLMSQGKHPEYAKWLIENGATDSTLNRVSYWGFNTYGKTPEGVALPLDQYQKEMANVLGRPVTLEEAAAKFADDLRVGSGGKPNGAMLDYILGGNEALIETVNGKSYGFTHAPITDDALGVMPGSGEKVAGTDWLAQRNNQFFKPALSRFISDAKRGVVPSDMLPNLGDARWDSVAKRVVHDSNSLSYTERPRVGDRYTGVYRRVAETFANDVVRPLAGLFSGHKPSGNIQTVHRMDIDGNQFLDVVADISRGPDAPGHVLSLNNAGDIQISQLGPDGKPIVTTVGQKTNPWIGMVTEDGFTVKAGPINGEYYLERYVGYKLETKTVPVAEMKKLKLAYSIGNSADDAILKAKVEALSTAIREAGGEVLTVDDASRVVGDRFVIDMRGASNWAALPDEKIADLRAQLKEFAASLDPERVVILTGGNRASNPNAFESLVHDVFAGKDAPKRFDIIGFTKWDTPADEVDKAVKYVVLVGEGNNWDGPVQAAMKFTQERAGVSVMVGGGGVLERSAQSPIAAEMKDRLFLMQGFGGASEKFAALGNSVTGFGELADELKQMNSYIFTSKGLISGPFGELPLDATCINKALEGALR